MTTLCVGMILAAITNSRMSVPTAAPDTDERQFQIRGVIDLYERVVNDSQVELLAPHVDDGFTDVMITNDTAVGLEGLKQSVARMQTLMGPGGRYNLAVNTKPAKIEGDMAWVEGRTEELVRMPGGIDYHATGAWTAILRKHGAAWRFQRIHATIDPIDNAFVRQKARRPRMSAGGGGLATGLASGLVIGLVMGRRRRKTE